MKKKTAITLGALALLATGIAFGGFKIKEKKEKDKIEKTLKTVLIPNAEKELDALTKQYSDLDDSIAYYENILKVADNQNVLTEMNDSLMYSQLKTLEDTLVSINYDVREEFFRILKQERRYLQNKNDFRFWYLSDGIIKKLKNKSIEISAVYRERNASGFGSWKEFHTNHYTPSLMTIEEYYDDRKFGYHVGRFLFNELMEELIFALRATQETFIVERPSAVSSINYYEREYKISGSYKEIKQVLVAVQTVLDNIDNSQKVINPETLEEAKYTVKKLLAFVEKQNAAEKLVGFKNAKKQVETKGNVKQKELKNYKSPGIVNRMYKQQRKK